MRFADNTPQPREDEDRPTYVNPPDMVGHLLLVWPIRYDRDVYTKYPRQDGKPSDAVFCDVVDLNLPDDNNKRGKLMRQCKWTQGRLIRDTKKFVGSPDPLLVAMGKDGDAYIIVRQETNPAAVQIAEEWASRNPGFTPGADAPVPREPEPTRSTWDSPVSGNVSTEQQDFGVWPPRTTTEPTSTPPAAPVSNTSAVMDRLRRQAGIPTDADQSREQNQDPAFQEAPF
jgi:hypothetical protein